MPLPSFLERFRRGPSSATSDAVPMSSSDVEAMRVRARRRLIGMVVLVGAGVVGFPWLFETKPRPMSGDIQIVQAQQAQLPAGSSPTAGATIAAVTAPAAPAVPVARVAPAEAEREEFVTDAPPKPAVVPSAPVAKPAASKPAAVAASKASPKPAEKPVDKPAAKAADKAKEKISDKAAEKASDKAKDKPAAKPADKASDKPADKKSDKDKSDKDKAGTRYVVQFGAFADANSAHEARMKAERLGLKTYAQQVDTPQGKRIRVRLGPYADKAEADKAAASLRKAGLPGAVLTL